MTYFRYPILAAVALTLPLLFGCQHMPSSSSTETEVTPTESPASQILKHAENLFSQGLFEQSSQQLATLTAPLTPTESARQHLLQARLLQQQNQPAAALKLLLNPPGKLPVESARLWLELRRKLALSQGQWLAASRDSLDLMPLLNEAEKTAGYRQLWQQLQTAKSTELKKALTQKESPELAGWLELAYLVRQQHQPDKLKQALRTWAKRYPQHPASQQLPPNLSWVRDLNWQIPSQIALILPMSGQASAALKPIVDGFNAARQYSGHRNRIMFYDSNTKDVTELYQEAVRDGNQVIVGPLEKEKVSQLAEWGQLTKPTLALNYAQKEGLSSAELYQFALAPEDELMQIAEQAWLEQHRHVLLLLPKNPYGQRVKQAFSQIWQGYGGQISAIAEYRNTAELPGLLRQHLKIADSEQRKARLQTELATPLQGTASPRPDVDLILMAGTRPEARQLKSILTSLYAQQIPVWGTSRLNDGAKNPGMDQELNGFRLTDAPWMLDEYFQTERARLTRGLPQYRDGAARLFAFGYDAYQLLPLLPILRKQPDYQLNGLSGSLLLDSQQRLQRRLVWSEYRQGRASIGQQPDISPSTTP